MQTASSLFLTAGLRLSDVARVFDNSSAMWKQIAECFLTFDNLGPMRKQIIECSSPIRQFRRANPCSWPSFEKRNILASENKQK